MRGPRGVRTLTAHRMPGGRLANSRHSSLKHRKSRSKTTPDGGNPAKEAAQDTVAAQAREALGVQAREDAVSGKAGKTDRRTKLAAGAHAAIAVSRGGSVAPGCDAHHHIPTAVAPEAPYKNRGSEAQAALEIQTKTYQGMAARQMH